MPELKMSTNKDGLLGGLSNSVRILSEHY